MHFTMSEKAIMRISVDLIAANSQLIYLKKIVGDIEAIDFRALFANYFNCTVQESCSKEIKRDFTAPIKRSALFCDPSQEIFSLELHPVCKRE